MTEHHDGLLEQNAYCVTDDVELGGGAEVTDEVFECRPPQSCSTGPTILCTPSKL
jgi:hypothetical protein